MALFLANRIIKGQTAFVKVPPALKKAVLEVLGQRGREELAAEV